MKREEILSRLGYRIPDSKRVRVIIHTDAKNEADDQYAIVHHLLTPLFDIRGIIAAHFEGRYTYVRKLSLPMTKEEEKAYFVGEGTSMKGSYDEIKKLLSICDIEDIRTVKGCTEALEDENGAPESEGVSLIIEECMKQDDRPLYLAMQGGMTDLAAALNKAPEIADKMTVIWIGGGAYPGGGIEFNLMQDIFAVRKIMKSNVSLWQVPSNVYQQVEVSVADLKVKVHPCGKIGKYLFDQLLEVNEYLSQFPDVIRKGENWCLGDQPTVGVLIQNELRGDYHIQKAPKIKDDLTYEADPQGRDIRVYDHIDDRQLLDDLWAKLKLCYE